MDQQLGERDRAKVSGLGVVHSTNVWLSQTMTWLDTQVRFLAPRIRSHIVCDHVHNLDQFPVQHLVSADRDRMAWRLLGSRVWMIQKWRRDLLVAKCARDCDARILHSHFGDQGWADLRAAADARLKHVVTFYGYDVGRLPRIAPVWNARYRELFAKADLFLCEGAHMRNCVIELGCPAEKVKVQHLGLDLERIPFQPRVWRQGQPLRILLAGSFTEKKGFPYALEALGRIGASVKIEITLVGDSDHQERNKREKVKILDAIERSGLRAQTRLLGYQPYAVLLDEARRNHIFLSPSVTASDGDTEGGAPVSIIEMAASGMPVVSTNHCDIPEVLRDGVTGLLAPERDVEGLSNKLRWLIENPSGWGAMTEAARAHVHREYSAPAQGESLARHYESLLP